METKQNIRKIVFKRRKEYTDEWILISSHKIFEQVISTKEYKEADMIFLYMDCKKEVRTREFIKKIWSDGKKAAVPKVNGKHMDFYILESFEQLEEGYFHIMEPAFGQITTDEHALMILPGVAFDEAHHRVGYGGGFYDRYLEAHPLHPTIAAAFEFQIFDSLPFEATDILPQYIITENRII